MPLYEYRCGDCAETFERLVRTWDEAVVCPACQGAAVEKQLSTFAMAFAGGAPPARAPRGGGGCGCGRGGCGCGH